MLLPKVNIYFLREAIDFGSYFANFATSLRNSRLISIYVIQRKKVHKQDAPSARFTHRPEIGRKVVVNTRHGSIGTSNILTIISVWLILLSSLRPCGQGAPVAAQERT